MEIHDLLIYRGRNIYSHKPVIKLIVDIGKYEDIPTKDIVGFNEKLITAFPNLKSNYCGLGYEGGFLDRLKEGTYLAHVLEHVILDMQYTLGYNVGFGKTRRIEPSLYYLVFEYMDQATGIECSKAAVYILNCFINDVETDVDETMQYLKKIAVDAQLGPSTSAIVDEALRRNIPVERFGQDNLVRLGYGKYSRVIESTLTDATSCISADIATNKQLTKSILYDNKIPVPYGRVVYSEASAVLAAKTIGFPVVVKPYNANQGKGVHLNLGSTEEVKKAFKEATKYSNGVIVEQFFFGCDYRILVVGDKISAASKRLSAKVKGDGVHNIEELVSITNLDPNRGECHEKPLTKIKLDSLAIDILNKKGLNSKYVPDSGEEVTLRENSNLSTGGTAIDCTDIVHPDNAQIAVRTAQAIGLDIAGIDMVCSDISKSYKEVGGAIVEVNAAPGLRMHLYPSEGKPRNVAKDIVDMMFPADFTFPIVSVTGTNGKTTTTRLISHVLARSGKTVGMTTTSGIYINNKCILEGDNTGPISAKMVLSHKEAEAVVLETARGGIIRAGLGYNLADIAVVTNITEDHLELDGINTLEDMAYVKSLVAEAVKPDGYVVLNAMDKMTGYILGRVKSKVILFSTDYSAKNNYSYLKEYIFVYSDDEFIYVKDIDKNIKVASIIDVPITHKGLVKCNIENCLAAVGALYGLGVPIEIIKDGIKSFDKNPGRFNIYDFSKFKVMLDYAHNKAGFEQLLKTAKEIAPKRLVGVIGMPGDRPDSAIAEVGAICAGCFDKLYIKEDSNSRGRQKDEVARILYNTAVNVGFDKANIKVIENELMALKDAVKEAKEGDLIVVSYEEIKPLAEFLNQGIRKEELVYAN